MTIILFIAILLILVFVHELGHFLVAKWNKIKVHEFALGFPPTLWKKKVGETEYSLNLVPFGGFVRIHGENAEDTLIENDADKNRSMVNKPWYVQIAVLVAGVLFNIIFAWLLISIAYMTGYPTAVQDGDNLSGNDSHIMILAIEENSPASNAGVMVGDRIVSIELDNKKIEPSSTDQVREAISLSEGKKVINMKLLRGGEIVDSQIHATSGIVSDRVAIGISMGYITVVKYNPIQALYQGLQTTGTELWAIVSGLYKLAIQSVTGQASLSSVTGPVGIARLVGDASQFGFAYLLGFTAFISLNLAVINMVPFPALDGGRVVVVAVEAITRRKFPASIQLWLNGIGFALLIILMILVTVGDIRKLF